MEKLKALKDQIVCCVEGQMGKLGETDTKELGEAIDMIKDLEEAMYYCSIVKAMEKAEKQEEMGLAGGEVGRRYYSRYLPEVYYPYPDPWERDMDRDMGRMYYTERQPRNEQGEFMPYRDDRGGRRTYGGNGSGGNGNSSSSGGSNGSSMGGSGMSYYSEREMPLELHDRREGRSPMSRRMYMESKELHKDKERKMKDLEQYMKELSEDIVEMIDDASPEEKTILEKKLTSLTSKVASLNA